ncbi:MAG: clostripain-related cysteine peptidase, partial [Ilumatobacteraceae bacterium]
MATSSFLPRRALHLAMVLSLTAAAACSDDGGGPLVDRVGTTVPGGVVGSTVVPASSVLTTTPVDGTKAWTVMVYMAGDNNLEQDAIDDLREMQAGVSDQMNLIAILDRSPEFSTEEFGPFGDWVGTRAMLITPTAVSDLGITGDLNMATTDVLESFVGQVTAAFPAEHHALFLWDHAGGWRGFAQDAASGEVLLSAEVAAAVGAGLASAGVDKLDVLVYDACLMAESEVLFSMMPIADVLLASEEVVPNHGNNYAELVNAVTGDGRHFAETMLAGYQAEAAEEGDSNAVTMSIIDLQQAPVLDAAMTSLANALGNVSGSEAADFLRTAGESLAFAYNPDPASNANLRDLGQLVAGFTSADPAINAALADVGAAIDTVVIDHIEGKSYTGAHGISVYVPTSIEYFDTRYPDLPGAASWTAVLEHVYNAGADAVVNISNDFVIEPTGVFDADGVSILGGVDPALVPNLVEITIVYGLAVEDGTFLWLGAAPARVIDPARGLIGGTVPLLRFEVTVDGFANSLLGSYSATPNPGNPDVALVSTSVIYSPPGQPDVIYPLTLQLAIDVNTEEVLSKAFYGTADNGTIAEVTLDPAGSLQMIIPVIANNLSITPANSAQFDTPPSIPSDLAALEVGFQLSTPGDGTPLGNS